MIQSPLVDINVHVKFKLTCLMMQCIIFASRRVLTGRPFRISRVMSLNLLMKRYVENKCYRNIQYTVEVKLDCIVLFS